MDETKLWFGLNGVMNQSRSTSVKRVNNPHQSEYATFKILKLPIDRISGLPWPGEAKLLIIQVHQVDRV